MKYIEELQTGDAFESNNETFFLTSDFKKNGNRLAFQLTKGFPKWFEADCMVDPIQLYKLDSTNTIIPIKETLKADGSQTIKIS